MSDADLQTAKINMLRRQLSGRGITAERVLAAMGKVPRERFVPPELHFEAYADRALGIDCGQTISQPYMVALMTEALELSGTEKVLEIGTGSGYQTAILAELAAEVVSIERHALLSQQALKFSKNWDIETCVYLWAMVRWAGRIRRLTIGSWSPPWRPNARRPCLNNFAKADSLSFPSAVTTTRFFKR